MAITKHPKIIIGIIIVLCAIFLFCGARYYFAKTYTGLASDKEMIAHFKEHRAEIEELVKRYREFDPETAEPAYAWMSNKKSGEYEEVPYKSHDLWTKQGDTPELLKKASINKIYLHSKIPAVDGSITIWLPDPYSAKSAKLAEEMIKSSKKINNWLSEQKPVEYQYGALVISLQPKAKYSKNVSEFEDVHKDIYYIPEVPLIKNGELVDPANIDGKRILKRSVVPSLNYIPSKWYSSNYFHDFSCVLKQIEPQWFLRMCATSCSAGLGTKSCGTTF
jgi:hypothetical protein